MDAAEPGGDSSAPIHLCRLTYRGHEDAWAFAFFKYSNEKYETSVLMTGQTVGTPEDALDTSSTHFY
jgi:hypothetical protein